MTLTKTVKRETSRHFSNEGGGFFKRESNKLATVRTRILDICEEE